MEYTSPSKEELLKSICPEMRLTKSLLKRIYGYGVTDPAFPDKAIASLETVGYNKARRLYESWVNEYETNRDAELKEVAHRYRLVCERQWEKRQKEGEEQRAPREKKQISKKWMDGLY